MAIACLLVVSALVRLPAQHIEMSFKVAGGQIGRNVYDQAADGSFTSHTDMAIGPTKVASDLTGRWVDGVPRDLRLVQASGANKIVIAIKGNKVVADVGKAHHELPFTYTGKLFFANLHPQLIRTLADVYRADIGGRQKAKAFVIEAQQPIDVDVSTLPARTGRRGDQTEIAIGFSVTFPNVIVSFYTSGDKQVVAMDAPSQQFQAVDSAVSGVLTDPIAAYPELSQATFKTKTVQGGMIPMRDGVKLAYDAMLPDTPGKYPVVLVRTPYGRTAQAALGSFYATRGYAYVVEDARGRDDSGGVWDPMVNEGKDGYDTIEWIAKQPWCDGNVGMIGASYGGYVQWAAAVKHPEALKCIVPQVSPPDAFYNIPYEYGTFPLLTDAWWLNVVRKRQADMSGLATLAPKPKGLLTLPLTGVPKATFGYDLPMLTTWLKRDRAADWKGYDYEKDVTSVDIPVLHISGWWDGDGIGTELNWLKLQAAGKRNQWLIEGPWTHAFNTTTRLGEYDFGPGAIRELDSVYLRWFDTWLKHKNVKLDAMPRASIFMTGANAWLDSAAFPQADAKKTVWFLGKGVLGAAPGDGVTRYTYDPAKADVTKLPKPLQTDVSLKLNVLLGRPGDVFFKSAPLPAATSFEGPITFHAYLRTDVVDTDLYAMLADVAPDGTVLATTQAGKLRLAYRNGFAKPELMKPGRVYAVTVRPWWFAHRFAKGHRIGLFVTSSAFPATARNLNTGEPIATATRMVVAHVQLLHDRAHPSSLTWYRLP